MLRQEASIEEWNTTGDMPVRRAPHAAFLVDGRILLWDTYTLPFQHSPSDVQKTLEPLGILCLDG